MASEPLEGLDIPGDGPDGNRRYMALVHEPNERGFIPVRIELWLEPGTANEAWAAISAAMAKAIDDRVRQS